jgi:adenine-specific DNA-methyltransferase
MLRPRFKTRYFPDETKSNPVSTWIAPREISDDQSGEVTSLNAGLNQEGTKEVRELLGSQILEYPKPLSLLRGLISIASREDDLIVDFFAGSGTTGHATWAANVADNGSRRFILVQLPEPTGREDFSTIADITKERLRRAAEKIKREAALFSGDVGFRVFKLDLSNIRAWNPEPANLEQSLFAHQDHILSERTEADVLYELLLKLGIDLCIGIDRRTLLGKEVHAVGGGVLMACLATSIAATEVEAVALGIINWRKELAPAGDTTCVFRDTAFGDDVAKTNMASILGQNGIQNVRSL